MAKHEITLAVVLILYEMKLKLILIYCECKRVLDCRIIICHYIWNFWGIVYKSLTLLLIRQHMIRCFYKKILLTIFV